MENKKYSILYIGNFRPPHSTENHIALTLESLGHFVTRFQEDETSYDCLLAQNGYDFMLYTRTWDNIISKEVNKLNFLLKKKIPLVGFHLDIWWGLERESQIAEQLYFKSDILFTADGGHPNKWKEREIEHCYLPPAVYKKECYIAQPRADLKRDIVFVGSYKNYHPEYPFRRELVEWLIKKYGERILFPNVQYPCVRGHLLNELYASSKIVIGDSLESPNYFSDRVFETIGRGGVLFHPTADIPLIDGTHYIQYKRRDWNELEEKINYYLTHDNEREKIRKEGHEFVTLNHTYDNRMEEMLQTLKEKKYVRAN